MIDHDIEALPKTKAEARSAGLKHYYTGKPCKRGHLAPRNLSAQCVECHREDVKAAYVANPEPQKKRSMERYERRKVEEPDALREEGRLKQAAWKAANYEHVLERSREYENRTRDHRNYLARLRYAKNPQWFRDKTKRNRNANANDESRRKNAEASRDWRKNNPELSRMHDKNKRAARRGAEGKFTCEDVSRIREAQKDKCAYCRKPLKGKGTVDHIVALANGGTNWPSNLQLACRSCNSRKRTKDAIDFAREHGMLL